MSDCATTGTTAQCCLIPIVSPISLCPTTMFSLTKVPQAGEALICQDV